MRLRTLSWSCQITGTGIRASVKSTSAYQLLTKMLKSLCTDGFQQYVVDRSSGVHSALGARHCVKVIIAVIEPKIMVMVIRP